MVPVRVVRADGGGNGESVYIDRYYGQSAGLIGQVINVAAGLRTFETLDATGNPNWSATQSINDTGAVTTVMLQPAMV